jgi:hypothetical protein
MYRHTWVGIRELTRGVESRDGLGDERTKGAQAYSGIEWYCVEHERPFGTEQ